jgi:hypothetical protein
MKTIIVTVSSPEEKQQFDQLLETAKSTTGNLACFEFKGNFFKVSRDSDISVWKLQRITQDEFSQFSIDASA